MINKNYFSVQPFKKLALIRRNVTLRYNYFDSPQIAEPRQGHGKDFCAKRNDLDVYMWHSIG